MSYPQTLAYLDSFINYEKKSVYPYKESFKLERILGFLETIGHPQKTLKCIHVAGTKGKGSISAFSAYILKEAGFKVGLYTSPHLSDVRERIRVLSPQSRARSQRDFEGMISAQDLEGLTQELKPKFDHYSKNSLYGPLSFFEVYTALAFSYFKEKKVDFAVLETGLGGRLDATNTVQPLICGISSISFDHTKQLGNTLAEIAAEKAGIIKGENLTVISAAQEKEVLEIIRARCKEAGALLYEIGKDITFTQTHADLQGMNFNVQGSFGEYNDLKIRLLGKHQLINATLALSLVSGLLQSQKIKVKIQDIQRGLYNTVWPGRFEIVSGQPPVVLDGAHNLASAGMLRKTLDENFPGRDITVILGASRDKDIQGICRELAPMAKKFILTQADNPRAVKAAEIFPDLNRYKSADNIMLTENLKEALSLAKKITDRQGLVVITGSLFLVGEGREILKLKA